MLKRYIIEYRIKTGDEFSKPKIIKVSAETVMDAIKRLTDSSDEIIIVSDVYSRTDKSRWRK